MTMARMRCSTCDTMKAVTKASSRASWRLDPYCRDCRHLIELFSWNGNRWSNYGV